MARVARSSTRQPRRWSCSLDTARPPDWPHSNATDLISQNSATFGAADVGGNGTLAHPGLPGVNGGKPGVGTLGVAGMFGVHGNGIGGGLFLDPDGTATLANTTITGNTASTSDGDVHGAFKTSS